MIIVPMMSLRMRSLLKLSESSRVQEDNQLITVSVQLGNRYLTDDTNGRVERFNHSKEEFYC